MIEHTFPKVIFGTSALGNLFSEPPYIKKRETVAEIIRHAAGVPVFDSAGKYGAGLALECLGKALRDLNVKPSEVKISNKLGWQRIPLTGQEPTFEPGAWVNLEHDAHQTISYQGVMDCYEQGNEILGTYKASLVSIHDPDEYIAKARNEQDRQKRIDDIFHAYRALAELKAVGAVESIGIGSKDHQIIDLISKSVKLDWAMFACNITPFTHKPDVIELVRRLGKQNVKVINSAVFNSGFLTGGTHFDYSIATHESHPQLFQWRDAFLKVCKKYDADPAAVCVQFSFRIPEIVSVALNTSSPSRVAGNIALATTPLKNAMWDELKGEGLIRI